MFLTRLLLLSAILVLSSLSEGCTEVESPPVPPGLNIIPRASSGPAVDGRLDDSCWDSALLLDDFAASRSMDKPEKATSARVTFDDKAIYFALSCEEPDPSKMRSTIKTENDNVWQDSCIEIYIRSSSDSLDFDQFIVNSLSTRGWHRIRGLPTGDKWEPAFKTRVVVGEKSWSAEFAIPFSDLGASTPASGDMFQVKIARAGREFSDGRGATWPPGARIGGGEDFAPVYFAAADPRRKNMPDDITKDTVGPAIPVKTDTDKPLVITKLLVKDCRAVRGFIGAPVDGSTNSWGWDARFYEYNRRNGGAGVKYDYMHNDGLHLKLADDKGFDALQIRGGVKADLYRDVPSYTGPQGGTLLRKLPGGTRGSTRVMFDTPVVTDSVSFFKVTDGYISDLTFFRVGRADADLPKPARMTVSGVLEPGDAPEHFTSRFDENDRTAYRFDKDAKPGKSVSLPAGRNIHLVSPPLEKETPLAAVGLDFDLDVPAGPTAMTVTVVDAVDTRRELFVADVKIDKPGRVRLVLDFPDQIIPKGTRLWLVIKSERAATLKQPVIDLYVVDRAKAAPEALAYRKLLLHGMYSAMSEARPWNTWYYQDKVDAWLASKIRYAPCVQNILDALNHCRYIGGNDEDVRQYYEWIWRGVLRKAGKTPPFETKYDLVPGAPEWASLLRQAWLQARAVPQWWIDNRMVPTGEVGGVLSDDSDMYQNYVNFVAFETDGVAAKLKDAAARLAKLCQETTMIDGINRRTMDPLHAYEEGLNQDALMAYWFYGDPVYLERCMTSARSVEQTTVITPEGHRHFRSQEIGADRRRDEQTDTDGHAHPLMWHPTFELVRYNGNPTALGWLRQWGDGWLEHMKPGKYAKSVEVAAEKVTVTGARPLPGGYGGQGSAFESLYWITGDAKYLSPFMDVYRTGKGSVTPGRMVSELYQRGGLKGVGDKLPELLKTDPVAYAQATGDKKPLCEKLRYDITELQRYKALYTTIEPFTDRVFLYAVITPTKAYTGGFATRNKFCRTHAVSYEGLGTDYAALVMKAGPDRFKVLIYNFADRELTGRMRMWTLQHGVYRLTTGIDTDNDDRPDDEERARVLEVMRATPISITLAPKKVTVIELTQVKKLDNELDRPDLALSPLDTRVSVGSVESVAHNIGAKEALSVVVALVDAGGKVRSKKQLGRLAAPTDLVPRRIPFRFDGLPNDIAGWSIIIDPDGEIAEIYEGNNRVKLADETVYR